MGRLKEGRRCLEEDEMGRVKMWVEWGRIYHQGERKGIGLRRSEGRGLI